MPEYAKSEARDWARERMKGVCGCLLPTLNTAVTKLNERAIRHDIRLEAEYGFWGTLLVSEVGTTNDEMRQFIDIAVDEAQQQGLRTVLQASFPTLQDTIDMVKYAESAGVDLVLLSYPLLFYPLTEQEVKDYTSAVADATDLGIILFAIGLWNFHRLHPSGFSPRLIGSIIDDVPNIVAVKNEIGGPGVGGIAEVFSRFKDQVVITDPVERNAPAWVEGFGMEFMGTSNYEYHGPEVPRYFEMLQSGKNADAMDIYWKLHPARVANGRVAEGFTGTSLVHRMVWKYQYWLNGFNGGPVRQPLMRINDNQMRTLRAGMEACGRRPAPGDDADFFVGRNPMD